MAVKRRGRPSKYAHYDALLAGLEPGAKKRPTYIHGIGLFKGERAISVWVKINMRRGGFLRGKHYAPGESCEIKLGQLSSWSWDDLVRERDRLQGLADRGEPLEEAPTMRFRQQAHEWLALKEGRPTYEIAKGHIDQHLEPWIGDRPLQEISPADVDRWQAAQLKRFKPATVQRQLVTLKAILNYAVKVGRLDRSPAANAEPIKGIEPRQRHLARDEWEAILTAADDLEADQREREKYATHELKGWLRNYLLWALHSGMRRGEILELRLTDIHAHASGRRYATVRISKSGKPRNVTCTPEMEAIIDRMVALPRREGDDRLFPVSLKTLKRWLPRVWKRAGLNDVRLHDFRRTHATQLVNSGADLYGVAYRLGHRDLKMLEKVYAQPLGDMHVADQAAKVFG